jgi:hypothetical protein
MDEETRRQASDLYMSATAIYAGKVTDAMRCDAMRCDAMRCDAVLSFRSCPLL